MPAMQFGLSAFERARGDLPALPVVNLFAEEAPTEETGIVLQSRPGLLDRGADMGDGPVEVLFQRDGVLDGVLFGVSGGYLYQGAFLLGDVPGGSPASIAGNEVGVIAAAGETAKFYDGSTLTEVDFPDAGPVAKVFTGASRFWLIREDTGKLYFTPPLETTVDALAFVTAESLPDRLLDGLWIDDTAVLFGAESVEFWPNTGDPDLPIQPLGGRVFERGIRATGCAAAFDANFAWVGDDNAVHISGGDRPQPISNTGLQAQIEASGECRLWTFQLEGQEFLALRIDAGTYVYGNRNRLWSRFASVGESNWLPQSWAAGVFGCSDGRTATWSTAHEDFDGEMERRFRGGFPLNSGGVRLDNVSLRVNVGQTPYLTGDNAEPQVEMRISRDAGQTWGNWMPRPLGRQGQYRSLLQWRSCGLASRPGSLHEFRLTAPVPFRVSEVVVNEGAIGR